MNTPDPLQPAEVFNLVAAGYDNAALRFFPFCADRLIVRLNPAPGSKILDVAAGTGAVALAAAQAVGESGRVAAIDLAGAMLDRLQEKIDKFGVRNIDLHVMDAAALEFRRDYFDYVICSFGLFFLPDMTAALREWARVARPGGRIVFTAFGKDAFQPMKELFVRRMEKFGIAPPDKDAPFAAARLADPARCRELLSQAGLEDIEVVTEQLGYHLKDEAQWWEVVWNTGMRAWVERVPPAARESFREEHLAEVRPFADEHGLWLNVEVHFASGRKRQSSAIG